MRDEKIAAGEIGPDELVVVRLIQAVQLIKRIRRCAP
jgi:hypothetical protein